MAKKKFDIKQIVNSVSDKDKFIAVLAVVAYQIFGAGKIKNRYLSNASIILVPAMLAGFFSKNKSLVSHMVVAGIAVGGLAFIRDIIAHMRAAETDPKKKAVYTQYLTALSGPPVDVVSGIGYQVPQNGNLSATYIPPREEKTVNLAALYSGVGTH